MEVPCPYEFRGDSCINWVRMKIERMKKSIDEVRREDRR